MAKKTLAAEIHSEFTMKVFCVLHQIIVMFTVFTEFLEF